MKLKSLSTWSVVALLAATAACTKSSPTRPSETELATATESTTDASSGTTFTSPIAQTPANNAKFAFTEQPITLTVKNAVSTGSSTLTYSFQVATDGAFTKVVYAKDGVAAGSGTTSLTIDKLAGQTDYFWRVRASTSKANGPYTKGRTFNVGPEVVLEAPGLVFPSDGGTANGAAPSLTVANAGRSGPAGALVYRFQVSDSPSFGNLIAEMTAQETPGQTSAQVNANLVSNATYYWRVQATDPSSGVTGPFSGVASFRYVPFDMRSAVIRNSPRDLGFWREGATITSVTFTGAAILVDFDRRNGGNRWPDVTPPGWAGGLQYTLGACLDINTQWYCSAPVEFWHGRDLEASGPPHLLAINWFYDPARWAPMTGHQPTEGETVGWFVCEGDCRNNVEGSSSPLKERSNVVLLPFTYGFAGYSFVNGKLIRTR
jgi:hypothetical protein